MGCPLLSLLSPCMLPATHKRAVLGHQLLCYRALQRRWSGQMLAACEYNQLDAACSVSASYSHWLAWFAFCCRRPRLPPPQFVVQPGSLEHAVLQLNQHALALTARKQQLVDGVLAP